MSSESALPTRRVVLEAPSLSSLAEAISKGLSSNFKKSSCTVDTPPDLTLPPYHLAASGLNGSARVADIGGPPYLQPSPDLTKKYDLKDISRAVDMDPSRGLIIGAGAGPFHVLGQNSELMTNFAYGAAAGGGVRNCTHFAKIVQPNDISCCQLPDSTGFGLMCNLFCSDGVSGPCLHVRAKSRFGALNFTEAIQNGLKAAFGDRLVSLGGVFLIKSGTAKLHVMPDFPSQPFGSRKDVDEWLRYFDLGFDHEDPLVCLSVLHSGDQGDLALRMEHTHCFTTSNDGEERTPTAKGGHYHYDIDSTKGEVEYEGWFNVAELLYRIDQPPA